MVSRLVALLGLVALFLLLAPAGAVESTPEKRVALVIGVGAYRSAPTLPNPPKDAHAIAQALSKLGFEVDEKLDVDNRTFAESLREFGVKAANADVAVFYFAGHGMQVERENYLVPADAKLEREHDLLYEAMRLDLVLGEASQARTLGIVILDACRNNPFIKHLGEQNVARSERGVEVGVGLARVDDPPKGTLVAMATRADSVAEDGQGDHSPYTQALLENLKPRGLELGLFFRKVRDDVLAATHGRQEPYTFGSLGAQAFYFNAEPPNHPPVVPALVPIDLSDSGGPKSLAIKGISDPDGDPVVAHVTALPKGGTVRLGDRTLLIGDTLNLDQLAAVTFTPDGSFSGQAGPFSFDADDGRGASVPASLFIKIVPSNHPPVVEAERSFAAASNLLNIRPPSDPDGDPLSITVTAVPSQGVVRDSAGAPVKLGDKIDPAELPRLSFDPGAATAGEVGSFGYVVEDGRGGRANGLVHISLGKGSVVAAAPVAAAPVVAKPVVSLAPAAPPPSSGGSTDCEHCPAMVEIPPGSFVMGDASGDASSRPVHRVTLKKGFAIAKTVVTSGEWKACVDGGACKRVAEMDTAPPESPAVNLSWDDAQDYLRWLGKLSGRHYRLPTEAEWEYAARAGTTTAYWWGDAKGEGKANCTDCGGAYNKAAPELVSTYAANPLGLSGMAGGVWEWMADCWFSTYAGAPKDGSARDKADCHTRVLRGGSWLNDHSYATSASRFFYEPDVRYIANGFRVVRDLP
jgi:formylglycine-generating enzyme required for sulfatase activity